MKIQSVCCNNRKKAFQVKVSKGILLFPYSKVEPRPSGRDPIATVLVDRELGGGRVHLCAGIWQGRDGS